MRNLKTRRNFYLSICIMFYTLTISNSKKKTITKIKTKTMGTIAIYLPVMDTP